MTNHIAQQYISLIQHHPCFAGLSHDELLELIHFGNEKQFKSGNKIISENTDANSFYFIIDGKVEVSKNGIPLTVLKPGEAIGLRDYEIYSQSGKRTADVIAQTETHLLEFKLEDFNHFLHAHPYIAESMQNNKIVFQRMGFIERISHFKHLSPEKILELTHQLIPVTYSEKEIIFKEGEQGDGCYIIEKGEVEIFTIDKTNSAKHTIATLTENMIFGEAALLTKLPRNATAEATKDSQLLILKNAVVEEILRSEVDASRSLKLLAKTRSRPKQKPGIEAHKLLTDTKETYYILKNPLNLTYHQISENEYLVWQLFDGWHSLEDIAVNLHSQHGIFDPGLIATLISKLQLEGFIEDMSGDNHDQESSGSRTTSQKFSNILQTKPAQMVIGFLAIFGLVVLGIIIISSFS